MTVSLTTEQRPRARVVALTGIGAVVIAILVGYLIAVGSWLPAAAVVVAGPAAIVLHRYPLAMIAFWIAIQPFLSAAEDGGSAKLALWIVHRLAPLLTLVVVVVAAAMRVSSRRLPRLTTPDFFLMAYVVVSLISIVYQSNEIVASIRVLHTRTIIPMVLYLLIRLLRPNQRDLQRLAPVLIFLMFTQATIGAMQWLAPGFLPSAWLGRAGTRTTGSLGQPGEFGTSMLFAGLLLLHIGLSGHSRRLRALAVPAFVSALVLSALTFSRATWLAGLVTLIGLLFVYRKAAKKTIAIGLVAISLTVISTSLGPTAEYFERRFYSTQSQESALSRLPVVIASIRMFEQKPLTGWGYGNFNRYDRQFQSSVDGLFVPEKDHSSHNLYLTLAAEQGIPGLLTYLALPGYWLAKSMSVRRRLSQDSARLLQVLWLVIAAHVIVNNFAVMTSSFGLGLWWMTLAMIGVIVTRAPERSDYAHAESRRPSTV